MQTVTTLRQIGGLNKTNLLKLALVSIFLTVVDTAQSYYLQRVVNVFSEANLMPRIFYSYGPIGYVMYSPIEFLAVYATLIVLWFWASYVIWYHRNVIVKRLARTQ